MKIDKETTIFVVTLGLILAFGIYMIGLLGSVDYQAVVHQLVQ